ncbi:MAG: acetoin utilization protein AcuC [Fimbriimonas ginsengisoli]|uniref:Acetoin utilization protein AcuC n=1 Tax=Fimbriimonas ginsengisoli TaxID=1005039 RepID=A0A931LZ00_FIMGI|nr:acetoin utilization protein AcuC [Fimbriimonas ginsengisoli]
MAQAPVFYDPRMLAYDFGPVHPLRPERLRRAMELLGRLDVLHTDPGLGMSEDVLRVHSPRYIEAVRRFSGQPASASGFGFDGLDNPPFEGMFEASLAYVGGTAAAARAVLGGESVAISLSGGLHHAHRERASGFCIFNDPAIAISILRERFERVAYIDIDVHHGDGVQGLFFADPTVLTCSIHEEGASLFPGTGWVNETGASGTAVNVPLEAGTTGDVWLWAFRHAILPTVEAFAPGAIVLQMGTDAHFLDPLAHLDVAAQDWLEAVRAVKGLGLPIVAVGGGGYNLTTVPRMWAAATLTLLGRAAPDRLPDDLAAAWGTTSFFDAEPPGPSGRGRAYAEAVATELANRPPREAERTPPAYS